MRVRVRASERVSERGTGDRLEFRRCGCSTVLSPRAIAHDKFVSPGFAHKHRVASCLHAEDLERMHASARQHWNQAGKGLRKTLIKVLWKRSQVPDIEPKKCNLEGIKKETQTMIKQQVGEKAWRMMTEVAIIPGGLYITTESIKK